MKTLLPTAISSFLGLTVANFVWQLMSNTSNWEVATERSFFQFIAIAVFVGLIVPEVRRLESKN